MKINFVKSQDESTVESQAFVRAFTDEDGIHIEISKSPHFGEDITYRVLTVDTDDSEGEGKLSVSLYSGFDEDHFEGFVAPDEDGSGYIEVVKT